MPVIADDDIDFDYYMRETDAQSKVKPAMEWLDAVMHQLSPAPDEVKHEVLPFGGGRVVFAPGEVTLWGGFNGSGKSQLQGQVLGDFALRGVPSCIASLEMQPQKTLARIARQMLNERKPSREKVAQYFRKTSETLWIYDQRGSVQPDRMVAVIKHCAEKLGIKHIAIDSMMKVVRGTDDFNGQKDFVDALTVAANDYNIHLHLVAHLRKGDGDERMPTRMEVAGAGAITDLVDNVLILWRNKKKERDFDAGKPVKATDPDAVLICDKQRNGDWEGRIPLLFDRQSLRYSEMPRSARF